MEDHSNTVPMTADDTVEYKIYSTASGEDFESLKTACMTLVEEETHGFLWNDQCFNLKVLTVANQTFLHGRTRFSDSSDDEWLIVYLLKRLTAWNSSLVVMVRDSFSDGQILLHETAEHIPRWLSEDVNANRVFLGRGKMLIIPAALCRGVATGDDDDDEKPFGSLKIDVSLAFIRDNFRACTASTAIQRCLDDKLKPFPQQALENLFFANVQLPLSVVHFFSNHPASVSQVVQAATTCDIVDRSQMRRAKLQVPGESVWTQVPMTKLHFANMRYKLERKFKGAGPLKSDEKGRELGKVLQLGVEILHARRHHATAASSSPSRQINEKKFASYLSTLKSKGYFEETIENSRLYNELREKAREAFVTSEAGDEEFLSSFAWERNIVEFFKNWTADVITEEEVKLPVASARTALPEESSEKFLEIDETEFNKLESQLSEGFKHMMGSGKNQRRRDDPDLQQQFPDLAETMSGFVKKKSDYEGVEAVTTSNEHEPVTFNCDQFMASLKKLEQQYAAGSDSDDDSEDDYSSSDDEEEDEENREEMLEYYKSMDAQLKPTKVHSKVAADDPLQVDMNLVKNFVQSYADETVDGAASVLLAAMGKK